jgi:hypothetical protein
MLTGRGTWQKEMRADGQAACTSIVAPPHVSMGRVHNLKTCHYPVYSTAQKCSRGINTVKDAGMGMHENEVRRHARA